MHAQNHIKPIAKGMEPAQKTLKDIDKLVGIIADNATGKLTHPGTKVHMHVIYKDDQESKDWTRRKCQVVRRSLRVPQRDAQ